MKIIMDDKVYIQNYDCDYLRHRGYDITFGEISPFAFYEVTDAKLIDVVKTDYHIINYLRVKNLKIKDIIKVLNKLTVQYKEETDHLKREGIEHVYLTYYKYLLYKEGKEIFLLPQGALYPSDRSCITCQNKICNHELMRKSKTYSFNPPGYDCLGFINPRDKNDQVLQLKK